MITIESESLRQLTFDIYRETGAPEDIARVVSDYQVDTNLWGHDSHGCIAVPRFVNDVHSWPFKGPDACGRTNPA